MRTTVDLPEDLHRAATTLAHDRRQSFSRTVSDLVRAGLERGASVSRVRLDDGLPSIDLGRRLTDEDVAVLQDVD